jgi:hypothetical protein
MLSCQTHLSESAMMAQHSDVGRRRRLQKPYHPLRACACPWKLQDSTLDHLVVASLIIGGGSHPAPARLDRRGYAWDPHHTGTTPTKATRLGCPHTPRQTSAQKITEHASPIAVPAVVCHQRLSVSRQRPKVTKHSTCTGVMRTHRCRRCRPQTYTRATKNGSPTTGPLPMGRVGGRTAAPSPWGSRP